MNIQGHDSLSVGEGQDFLNSWFLSVKKTLVRLDDKGHKLCSADNDTLIKWFAETGGKLDKKPTFDKLKIKSALGYLMHGNMCKTVDKIQTTLTNVLQIETIRSAEIKRLHQKVEGFDYDKQMWARQTIAFQKEINELRIQLQNVQGYKTKLEECCINVGFPVASLKQSLLDSIRREQDSSDDDILVSANLAPVRRARAERVDEWEENNVIEISDLTNSLASKVRDRSPLHRQNSTKRRSPVITRSLEKQTPGKTSTQQVAVIKTIVGPEDTRTTVSRALTCDECNAHKNIIGDLPRKEPFEPYWQAVLAQTNTFNLELRDVWQIVMVTIPRELKCKLSPELADGSIMTKRTFETEGEVLERLKQALLVVRGPTHTSWGRILCVKQDRDEPYETFAGRLWIAFNEFSGITNPSRDDEVLVQLLKENAGSHVQKAIAVGSCPPQNTFDAIVRWVTDMERCQINMQSEGQVAATNWVTEGPKQNGEWPQTGRNYRPRIESHFPICNFCKKSGHKTEDCLKLQNKPNYRREFNYTPGKPSAPKENRDESDEMLFIKNTISQLTKRMHEINNDKMPFKPQ